MADKPQRSWQARSEFNERRYRRVDTRVWNDARVRGFSPNGRLVWMLLLTAPSTTAIPGLFRLREEEGAALCGLPLEGFREGFAEGFRLGLVDADWEAGVVWVRKASRYEWPTAPNVVKNWRKVLRSEIPESPLVARAMSQILKELQRVYETPEPFRKAFTEAFPEGFAEGLPEPLPEGSPAQDAGCRMQDAGDPSASQRPADAGPERPELVLTAQKPGKPPRKHREPTQAEKLYKDLQDSRQERCAEVGETWISDNWDFARQNERLKPLCGLPPEEGERLTRAWELYLADPDNRAREPPWSLAYFLSPGVRSKYETRAAREAEA